MSVFEQWRISKSRDSCLGCGQLFAPNQAFYSCLLETEQEFVRQDFCPACWQQRNGQPVFCFWKSRRAPENARPTVSTELLLEFFERLDQPDSEQKRIFRFVLALYLARRKEFKLLEVTRRDGGERLQFECRSSGRRVEVDNPGLGEEQIQQAADQLSHLLNANL